MSDDEYYEEFDDIFWIEEPEPDAAVSFVPSFLCSVAGASRY